MKSLIPGHCNIRSGKVRAGADLHGLSICHRGKRIKQSASAQGMRMLELTEGQTFCKMVMHLTGLAAILTWEVESLGFGCAYGGRLTCSLLQT